MSKITNDGLPRSGTGCFIMRTHTTTMGLKGLISYSVGPLYYHELILDVICGISNPTSRQHGANNYQPNVTGHNKH